MRASLALTPSVLPDLAPRAAVAASAGGSQELTAVSPLRPSAPSSSQASALSPNAAPFHPGAGRSKARHWADEDIVDAPVSDTVPISYLDALRRATPPPRPLPRPKPPLSRTRHSSSGQASVVPGHQGGG